MPKSWRVARSLLKLLDQINTFAPTRDKDSDGSIGDQSHAARKSDHNPNAAGVVRAVDIDEDLGTAVTLQQIVDSIAASKDKRVRYIIYEGKITVEGSKLQSWKIYTGVNAHRHHAHFSVSNESTLYDDVSEWSIFGTAPVASTSPSTDERHYVVRRGDTLWGIARRFTTSVESVKRLNSLTSDVIQIEQKLRVR